MNLADAPDVLTIEEACELLRIGRTAGYEAARRGDLPAIRVGRSLRIPRHALEQMLTAAGTDSPQTNGASGEAGAGKESNERGLTDCTAEPPRRG